MVLEDATVSTSFQATGTRRVLVADDQPDVREALRLLLKGANYAVDLAACPSEALAMASCDDHDLMVIDMNYARDTTSGREGLNLVERLHAQRHDVPIIAMTAWSTIELAVEAMHRGASDFVTKPWDNHRLLAILEKHLKSESLGRENISPIRAELALARKVQRKLLPNPRFRRGSLECECVCLPISEIGGDLYDIFPASPDSVAFLLGDVCGKGIAAALLMSNLLATIRSQEEFCGQPAELLSRVNRLFFRSTRPEHFATLFFGLYDEASSEIRYVNCGQPAGVLVRANGAVELLGSTATLLGAFENATFAEQRIRVAPGDRLVLYSDGVSEAGAQMESDEWVADAVRSLALTRSGAIAGALAAAAGSLGEQQDDISVMDLRISSTPVPPRTPAQ